MGSGSQTRRACGQGTGTPCRVWATGLVPGAGGWERGVCPTRRGDGARSWRADRLCSLLSAPGVEPRSSQWKRRVLTPAPHERPRTGRLKSALWRQRLPLPAAQGRAPALPHTSSAVEASAAAPQACGPGPGGRRLRRLGRAGRRPGGTGPRRRAAEAPAGRQAGPRLEEKWPSGF